MRMWGLLFLVLCVSEAHAADSVLDAPGLGKSFNYLRSWKPVLGVRETLSGGTAVYGGAEYQPSARMAITMGAAYDTYQTNLATQQYGMMDPNSPAMQAERQSWIDRHASVSGGSGIRLGFAGTLLRPGLKAKFLLDHRGSMYYEVEAKTTHLGSQVMVQYRIKN